MKRIFFMIIIALLIGATFFSDVLLRFVPQSEDELSMLRLENENLKTQIQTHTVSTESLRENIFTAKVFSRYPFNISHSLTINAGKNDKVRKSSIVTWGDTIFIGQVTEVFEGSSIVRTLYDPTWQLPVRIGNEEVDGLLHGGNEPEIVLIGPTQQVAIGDIVVSAGEEFPYGLKIGEISEIMEEGAGIFKKAVLSLPYVLNEVREVNVEIVQP